jgi:hypothetical protein
MVKQKQVDPSLLDALSHAPPPPSYPMNKPHHRGADSHQYGDKESRSPFKQQGNTDSSLHGEAKGRTPFQQQGNTDSSLHGEAKGRTPFQQHRNTDSGGGGDRGTRNVALQNIRASQQNSVLRGAAGLAQSVPAQNGQLHDGKQAFLRDRDLAMNSHQQTSANDGGGGARNNQPRAQTNS